MDVVRTNIEQIGGTIDLKSVAGDGTTFTIKIPLTLAIVSALIVEAGGERFAIPQISVVELVRAQRAGGEHRIERINDTPVLRLRNRLLPLVNLKELLRLGERDSGRSGYVVVTQVGSQMLGIIVDRVFDTEEIVVKPVSPKLRHITMFSGNTILGDGSVIMILDPNGIAQALGRAAQAAQADERGRSAGDERGRSDENGAAGVPRRFAAAEGGAAGAGRAARGDRLPTRSKSPTAAISCSIATSSCRCCASTRRGVKQDGAQPMLVFSDRGRSMGLMVDEIVDIVEDRLDIEVASERPGMLGYAVIKGKRPRSSTSAIACRRPSPTGSAAASCGARGCAHGAAGGRSPSSATCWCR